MKNSILCMFLFSVIVYSPCQSAERANLPPGWPVRGVIYVPGDRPVDLSPYKTRITFINDVKGYGLVADEEIPQGALIAEYTGRSKVVHHSAIPQLPYALSVGNFYPRTSTFDYCAVGGEYQRIIDAESFGNETRFCNHSSCPNAIPVKDYRISNTQIWIVANRVIRPGEEITFDYGPGYWRGKGITPQ